jgi:hypothetical protein
MKLESDEEIEN